MNKNICAFSLHNTEFFKKTLDTPLYEVLDKYSNLIHDYIKFVAENFNNKNNLYTRFIIIRGLDTITNVFNNILYYTKNIDITYFHSQKSFFYYVEFIEQISNDNNSFLQLSSRDSTLYVYKKTLFEINNEYRTKMEKPCIEENKKLFLLNEYLKIYKMLFSKLIEDDDFLFNEKSEEKNILLNELSKIIKKINNSNMVENELLIFQLFINKLISLNKNIYHFFECITNIVKKIKKKTILREKLFSEDFELYLQHG
jgi:hypothetical protein